MKKRSKKLRLNRETILKLEESELAKGGIPNTVSCPRCPEPIPPTLFDCE